MGRGDGDDRIVRRWSVLALLIVVFTMVALPALAQEDFSAETAGGQAINSLVTVTFLALVIQYFVEWLRSRWESVDGDIIRLISLVIGFGAAYFWELDVAADFGFEGLPTVLGYLVAAFVIAGISGIFGSGKNAIRSKDPASSMQKKGR